MPSGMALLRDRFQNNIIVCMLQVITPPEYAVLEPYVNISDINDMAAPVIQVRLNGGINGLMLGCTLAKSCTCSLFLWMSHGLISAADAGC